MQQRIPSLLPRPILFAHRGARAHAPENTVEAFELALRLGATGLATDVRVTADGEAVLHHHDQYRTGRLRKQRIGEASRAELPAPVPTLGELVDACGTSFELAVDLRDARSGPIAIDTIRRTAPELLSRTWLCGDDLERLVALRTIDDQVKLIDSTRLDRIKEGPERRAARLAERGIDGIGMRGQDWNAGLVTMFHRFGLVAFARDLQHEHELVTAIRMGADAVFSDHVDRMSDAARSELD